MENKDYGLPENENINGKADNAADLDKIKKSGEQEKPAQAPAVTPDGMPAGTPKQAPPANPGATPLEMPSSAPTEVPANAPTEKPPCAPAEIPASAPTEMPSSAPAELPSNTNVPGAARYSSQAQPSGSPNTKYRWSYQGQQEHNKKHRRGGGVLTYAIIMTVAFCLCFITLLGVILTDSGYFTPSETRTIYVREYDSESGVLTVPEIISKCKPSVVRIECTSSDLSSSGGSGIILTDDGYIATNCHVIKDSVECTVVTVDDERYSATIIGFDELSDLALIKIDAKGLTPAEIGDSSMLIEGEPVVAIGNPLGSEFANTATNGIISAVSRDVKIYDSTGILTKKMTLIQTNAAVNPGNSGCPLLNERGQVIGIVNMKMTKTNYDGIGFAIPINGAMEVLNEIKLTGSYSGGAIASRRPLIGITAGGIREGDEYTLDDGTKGVAEVSGVIVSALTPGLDAANKLQTGDIIVEVDGKRVSNIYEVMDIVNNKSGGDTINVKYYRAGNYNTVTITLGTEQ